MPAIISPRWTPFLTASWVALPLRRNISSLWEPTNTTSAPAAIMALQDDASKLPPNDIATIISPTRSNLVRSMAFIMAILSDMLTGARTRSMASSMSIEHRSIRSEKHLISAGRANWKCPLSVSMPPISISATFLSILLPAKSMSSLTISQHDVRESSQ